MSLAILMSSTIVDFRFQYLGRLRQCSSNRL